MGEGTVFNGDTLPGPEPGPFGPAEGDVFNGVSLQGPATGGDSGGGGLGLGFGTLFPPMPPAVPVPNGGPLVLTAIQPGNPVTLYEPYMQYNAATGGTPPYTWELVGGAYPTGTGPLTFSTAANLWQVYGNYMLQSGPFSYTLQVTDSSGIVSVANTGGDTYQGDPITTFNGGAISTNADNQLVMIIFVSANESASSEVAEITSLTTNGDALTFTRVFHDESYTYSDSAGDPGLPVATVSIDIFTAIAVTQIGSLGWTAHGTGKVNHGTTMRFAVNGLADNANPFDSGHSPSAFPNVATNLTGSASAPTNLGIATSTPAECMFALTLNHTAGGGGDAVPAQDPSGWVPIPSGSKENHGGASGFSFFTSTKAVQTIQHGVTVTAGFTDDYWYQAIFAFVGAGGGFQQTATATITGNVSPVQPGTTTIEGPAGTGNLVTETESSTGPYFLAPAYNTLMIELFAGTDGPTTIASTFGARYSSSGSETTIIINHSDVGAPPTDGPIQYVIADGSPPGHIVFSWI